MSSIFIFGTGKRQTNNLELGVIKSVRFEEKQLSGGRQTGQVKHSQNLNLIIKMKISLSFSQWIIPREEKQILTVDYRKVEKLRQKLSISISSLHWDQFFILPLKEKVGINIFLSLEKRSDHVQCLLNKISFTNETGCNPQAFLHDW